MKQQAISYMSIVKSMYGCLFYGFWKCGTQVIINKDSVFQLTKIESIVHNVIVRCVWFVFESSESGWNCFENLLISFMAWITHVYMCVLYAHWHSHYGAPLHCLSFFPLFFSSLILTRIWIIYIPQKCVGLFDFPFPAGYTHINLSACFIFVLFFVIVYIVFFCSTFSEAVSGEPPGIFMMVSIWMCKIYGILVWDHMYAFKLTPPSHWMKK